MSGIPEENELGNSSISLQIAGAHPSPDDPVMADLRPANRQNEVVETRPHVRFVAVAVAAVAAVAAAAAGAGGGGGDGGVAAAAAGGGVGAADAVVVGVVGVLGALGVVIAVEVVAVAAVAIVAVVVCCGNCFAPHELTHSGVVGQHGTAGGAAARQRGDLRHDSSGCGTGRGELRFGLAGQGPTQRQAFRGEDTRQGIGSLFSFLGLCRNLCLGPRMSCVCLNKGLLSALTSRWF